MRQEAETRPISGLKKVRHQIETAVISSLVWVIQRFSFKTGMRFADVLTAVIWLFIRADRKVAHANLDLVFGDSMTPARKKQVAYRGFRNLIRNLVTAAWVPNMDSAAIESLAVLSVEDRATFARWLASGRGMMFVTPHYGNWEFLAMLAAWLGFKLVIVAETVGNPAVDQVLTGLREQTGSQMIPPGFAGMRMAKVLEQGGATAILIDVNGRRMRGGVWCDFFGLDVYCSTSAAGLAMRTNSIIACGVAIPRDDGRLDIRVYPEVPISRTGDKQFDLRQTQQSCLDLVEQLIREDPEHWLWTYKRWKRRPTPPVGRYPYYSKYAAVDRFARAAEKSDADQ